MVSISFSHIFLSCSKETIAMLLAFFMLNVIYQHTKMKQSYQFPHNSDELPKEKKKELVYLGSTGTVRG